MVINIKEEPSSGYKSLVEKVRRSEIIQIPISNLFYFFLTSAISFHPTTPSKLAPVCLPLTLLLEDGPLKGQYMILVHSEHYSLYSRSLHPHHYFTHARLFYPEHGGSRLLRNICNYQPDYMVLHS